MEINRWMYVTQLRKELRTLTTEDIEATIAELDIGIVVGAGKGSYHVPKDFTKAMKPKTKNPKSKPAWDAKVIINRLKQKKLVNKAYTYRDNKEVRLNKNIVNELREWTQEDTDCHVATEMPTQNIAVNSTQEIATLKENISRQDEKISRQDKEIIILTKALKKLEDNIWEVIRHNNSLIERHDRNPEVKLELLNL